MTGQSFRLPVVESASILGSGLDFLVPKDGALKRRGQPRLFFLTTCEPRSATSEFKTRLPTHGDLNLWSATKSPPNILGNADVGQPICWVLAKLSL
jgi:hypothetical protein